MLLRKLAGMRPAPVVLRRGRHRPVVDGGGRDDWPEAHISGAVISHSETSNVTGAPLIGPDGRSAPPGRAAIGRTKNEARLDFGQLHPWMHPARPFGPLDSLASGFWLLLPRCQALPFIHHHLSPDPCGHVTPLICQSIQLHTFVFLLSFGFVAFFCPHSMPPFSSL